MDKKRSQALIQALNQVETVDVSDLESLCSLDDEPSNSVLYTIAYSDSSSDDDFDTDSIESDSDFGVHMINPIPHVLPIKEDLPLPLAKVHLLTDAYAKPIPVIAFFVCRQVWDYVIREEDGSWGDYNPVPWHGNFQRKIPAPTTCGPRITKVSGLIIFTKDDSTVSWVSQLPEPSQPPSPPHKTPPSPDKPPPISPPPPKLSPYNQKALSILHQDSPVFPITKDPSCSYSLEYEQEFPALTAFEHLDSRTKHDWKIKNPTTIGPTRHANTISLAEATLNW
ncbi:hypothetical protein Tco_0552037 [Tanacetum coccineum]